MAGLAEAVQGAVGQPSSVRIGRVDSVDPVVISAQGVAFDDLGFLGGYIPVVGDTVALLGQSAGVGSDPASWLVLGAVRPIPSPIAVLRQTSSQAVPDSTLTALVFDVAAIDTAGGWDPATPTRWTAPVTGYYQVSGGVSWTANAAGGRTIHLRVNGGDHPGSSAAVPGTSAVSLRIPARTMQMLLNAGDYIELWVFQDTGGNLDTVSFVGTRESTMEVRLI